MTLQESIQLCTTSFKLTKEEAVIFVNQQHSDQPADVRAAAIAAAYQDAVTPDAAVPVVEPVVQPVPVAPNTPTIWTFKDIALPMIARGVPVTVLNDSSNKEKGKAPRLGNWQNTATTDPNQIAQWDRQFPNANCGSVAQAKIGGYWMLEIDSAEVWDRIERETEKKIPLTFSVRSGSQGRGHFYWKQTPESIQMGNIAQTFVRHGDWSARCDREQCVSPGSVHPKTGRRYEVLHDVEIVEAPAWLVSWCISQKSTASPAQKANSAPAGNSNVAASESGYGVTYGPGIPIHEGGRNAALASYAGWLRQVKQYEEDQIVEELLQNNKKDFHPPLPDEEVIRTAKSVARYPIKDTTVLVGGVPAGSARPQQQTVVQAAPFEIPEADLLPYPKFPYWIMQGTSVYEGLIKPICDQNSRYPEYMFMPALTLLLNYVACKVRIDMDNTIPSIFMISIGKRGETLKSSSVEDAIEYFQNMQFVDHADPDMTTADGKSCVWTAGSPEGLGSDMYRTNCKNAVLFYDELGSLTNKAGIESSNLGKTLLTIYESGKFANKVNGKKETYSIKPKTYCVSLIACCTPKNFHSSWEKLAGRDGSDGLEDRFFFLYEPETLKERTAKITVPTYEGAQKTKQLINKAVGQAVFKMLVSPGLLDKALRIGSNRMYLRACKFALYFCIDLGLDEIDDDCLERGIALATYERDVKRFLKPCDAESKIAGHQNEVRRVLMSQPGWTMPLYGKAGLEHAMRAHGRFAMDYWKKAILQDMIRANVIVQSGTGTKEDPVMLQLLIGLDRTEED